jgi:enoyl-[acyl-carrier protein] reductase II
VSALLHDILPAGDIVRTLWKEFKEGLANPLNNTKFIYED